MVNSLTYRQVACLPHKKKRFYFVGETYIPFESESKKSLSYVQLFVTHGILQARILDWVAFPFSPDLPKPGIEPRSPSLQAISLLSNIFICKQFLYLQANSPAKPPEKPKNTGVGSLSLLQGISPTQGLNSGLLHCSQIIYCVNHQGSPRILEWVVYPFSSRFS